MAQLIKHSNCGQRVFGWLAAFPNDLDPARSNPPRVLMIQRCVPLDRPSELVAFQVETGQAEQLAALELPIADDLEPESFAGVLSSKIETIWNQLISTGNYSDVLLLEAGLARFRLELSPAPAIVLSLPKMAVPRDQGLHSVPTTWPIESQWLEWLGLYASVSPLAANAPSKASAWSSSLHVPTPRYSQASLSAPASTA